MAQKLLIKNAQIVTMDDTLGDFAGADILVEQGTIAAVGENLQAAGAEQIDAAGMIALPGIIDAHTCLWQTVLRGYITDLWKGIYFPEFLPLRTRFRPEDNFNAGYVGGFEMLSYGTTTVVDYCHNVLGPGYAEAALGGLAETGIRRVFTYSFMSAQPDLFGGKDARYRDASDFYQRFSDPDGLTDVHFGLESFGGDELPNQLAFMRERGTRGCIHVHAAGTIDAMVEQVMIGPDLVAIHGNEIADSELAKMAAVGMPICFTPTVDVHGTRADVVRRALDLAVPVVFGCDIPCHVASDPIMQLRAMYNVQGYIDGDLERRAGRAEGRRPQSRPGMPLLPRDLFEIATIHTARVFGLEDRVGSLTPGKRADILLIRRGDFGNSVSDDPLAHIMLHTTAREIDTVIVDGEFRMRGGALMGFDRDRAEAMMAESARHILGDARVERR